MTETATCGDTPAETDRRPEPSLSESLAAFTADLSLAQVPGQVVQHAKLLLLDLLGAALAGVGTEESRAILAASRAFGPADGACTLWGTMRRTSPAVAALVNGTIAHAQELDDFGGADHSGAVVVPTVLAIAQAQRIADGARVLEAMIAGYDVALRVLEAAGGYRAHNNHSGWHSTGTCGSFGAAAAAARMLGLDARRTAWALGLAGSFTGGTWAYLADGAMSKRYHPGRAAEIGLTAGYLAREGFTGPTRVLEADWGGFLPTYAGDAACPEAITAGLGSEHRIMKSGIKPYASCRGVHSVLDVIFGLCATHALRAADVASVEIRCNVASLMSLGERDPQTRLAAQMSLPYGVAVALVTGRASLAEYEPHRLADSAVREMIGRIRMSVDPAIDENTEPYVTVITTDGRRLQGHEPIGLGDPRNALPEDAIVAKFDDLAPRALAGGTVERLRDAVLTLPAPGSLARLLDALGSPRVAD